MQRIESGKLRGRRLQPLPKNVAGLRPTAARVRGAIFDRLGREIVGARVLDLFAGSGALSFEALSRGAVHATLVELDPRVVRHLQQQAAALGLEAAVRVVRGDAIEVARRGAVGGPFDLALVDPPFATPEVIEPLIAALLPCLAPEAVVVCERERIRGKSVDVAWPEGLEVEATRVYGQAEVTFLRSCARAPVLERAGRAGG